MKNENSEFPDAAKIVDSTATTTHFLRRDVERYSSKINFRVVVNTGYDEEETWSSGSSLENSAQSKDDRTLVLLHDLYTHQKRDRCRDNDEKYRHHGEYERAHRVVAIVRICKVELRWELRAYGSYGL